MERRLKLTPVNSKNRRTTTTEDEEPSSPDFRSLLEDYNLKSPSSMKIKPTRREPSHSPVHNSSSPSSSVSPTRVEEQYQPQTSTPTTHQERNLFTNNNKPSSAARRVCSFAEERPISDEVLLSTPNRYSTSTLPPMASSFQADVDEELDYVEVKRGPTTPLVPNSAQQSEILSLFSTPNIDTPARALQTPSTSTQPTLEDTPATEDVEMPPVLNTINNELKQVVETSEEQVVDIVNVTKVETTTPNLEELEELKIEELIRGSREERLLFTDHKRALLVLTLVIVLPLVALDLGLTVFSPYSLLTLIFLSLFNAYMKPVAADICNYYEITQKKQAYLPFITSFICCLVVYFTVIFILLKKFSFESKWKHTCRENHKATLARIERIIQLNQTCTN